MTIIGYSLNDTIIVFDRVRSDLKVKKTTPMKATTTTTVLVCMLTISLIINIFTLDRWLAWREWAWHLMDLPGVEEAWETSTLEDRDWIVHTKEYVTFEYTPDADEFGITE